METIEWRLAFHGFSTNRGGGVGVDLYAFDGTSISLYFNLEFACSNNEAKYKALIMGLISALYLGIPRHMMQGYSKMIIKQVNGEFVEKEISPVFHRTAIQNLIRSFSCIQLEHAL